VFELREGWVRYNETYPDSVRSHEGAYQENDDYQSLYELVFPGIIEEIFPDITLVYGEPEPYKGLQPVNDFRWYNTFGLANGPYSKSPYNYVTDDGRRLGEFRITDDAEWEETTHTTTRIVHGGLEGIGLSSSSGNANEAAHFYGTLTYTHHDVTSVKADKLKDATGAALSFGTEKTWDGQPIPYIYVGADNATNLAALVNATVTATAGNRDNALSNYETVNPNIVWKSLNGKVTFKGDTVKVPNPQIARWSDGIPYNSKGGVVPDSVPFARPGYELVDNNGVKVRDIPSDTLLIWDTLVENDYDTVFRTYYKGTEAYGNPPKQLAGSWPKYWGEKPWLDTLVVYSVENGFSSNLAHLFRDTLVVEVVSAVDSVVITSPAGPVTLTGNTAIAAIAAIWPSEASLGERGEDFTWSSDPAGIIELRKDTAGIYYIHPLANGVTTVRATSVLDITKYDEVLVTVDVAVEFPNIEDEDSVAVGESLQLTAKVNPAGTVTWSFADVDAEGNSAYTEYATLTEGGLITGLLEGVVTVKATSVEDSTKSNTHEVIVYRYQPTDVTFVGGDAHTINIGEQKQLEAQVRPASAQASTIFTWESDAPEIASIDGETGLVTGVNVGTANITVTTHNGKTARGTVTVVWGDAVPTTGVHFEATEVTIDLDVDSFALLTAIVEPDSATFKEVDFSTTSTKIELLSVDADSVALPIGQVRVKGLETGAATVRVTTRSGNYQDLAVVTIIGTGVDTTDTVAPEVPVEGIELHSTREVICPFTGDSTHEGEENDHTATITFTVTPSNHTQELTGFVWEILSGGELLASETFEDYVSEDQQSVTVTANSEGNTGEVVIALTVEIAGDEVVALSDTITLKVERPSHAEVVGDGNVNAYFYNGELYINSGVSEIVSVYSIDGAKILSVSKPAGEISVNLSAKGVLIVRGQSGWTQKVVR